MYRIVLNETSYYGAGCRSVIADEIRKRGFKKVLLVTDKDRRGREDRGGAPRGGHSL